MLTRNPLNKKSAVQHRIQLMNWREKLMNRQDIYSFKNFDFLASSFARMNGEGRRIDIDAVTGNMSEAQSAWFRERYNHYRKQGLQLTMSAARNETDLCA